LQPGNFLAQRHQCLDAARRQPALEQLLLVVERTGEEQLSQRIEIVGA
jgi:hypothetical protein